MNFWTSFVWPANNNWFVIKEFVDITDYYDPPRRLWVIDVWSRSLTLVQATRHLNRNHFAYIGFTFYYYRIECCASSPTHVRRFGRFLSVCLLNWNEVIRAELIFSAVWRLLTRRFGFGSAEATTTTLTEAMHVKNHRCFLHHWLTIIKEDWGKRSISFKWHRALARHSMIFTGRQFTQIWNILVLMRQLLFCIPLRITTTRSSYRIHVHWHKKSFQNRRLLLLLLLLI